MKKDDIQVVELSKLMDIISKCTVGRGKNWVDYNKFMTELGNTDTIRVLSSTPNNVERIIFNGRRNRLNGGAKYFKTKQEIANSLSISRQTLSRWEKEKVVILKKKTCGYCIESVLAQLERWRIKYINHKKP